MSNISKRRREGARPKIKTLGDHKEFLKRISKSLYYGKLPSLPCLSLPVTEISAEVFSEAQRGRSLRRLHVDAAAELTRSACVSPCSLVLAILYLERLKTSNPVYLARIEPSELFLVSLMVSNKFLQDDGEEDEVFCDEWATSGDIDISTLKHLEKDFLNAIDWRVYVSEQAFEAGLSWLERQVALKQANLRGFFTYADLDASSGLLAVGELLRSFSSICLTLTLSYITSLLALVTSTLLISNSLLPSAHPTSSLSPTAIDTNNNLLTPPNTETADLGMTRLSSNATVDSSELDLTLDSLEKVFTTQTEINKMTCCSQWWGIHYKYGMDRTDWLDCVGLCVRQDAQQSWWWRTSAFNLLYQFSLITPLQKWLDKLYQWNTLLGLDIFNLTEQNYEVASGQQGTFYQDEIKCHNLWLNLGKFNGFLVSVSDR